MEPSFQHIHQYIIERCLSGDRKAQYELYKLYVKAMYNICKRMMGDNEEARDILQDSFVTAFSRLDTYKQESSFGAWLKRIVVNNCINALKKQKPIFELNEELEIWEEETDDEDIIKYKASQIMEAIGKISEGCRTVLNLYLFEGYDHKEIAEILSISEATSKAQYSKAKQKVRDILLGLNAKRYEGQA